MQNSRLPTAMNQAAESKSIQGDDCSTASKLQRQRQQLFKVWHPESCDRVPPSRRIPARVRDDTATGNRRSSLAVDTIAADALAARDVRETFEADCVDCGAESQCLFLMDSGDEHVRHGFRKPRAGFPALKRASLRRAMTEEKTGAAAEVPPERPPAALTTTP